MRLLYSRHDPGSGRVAEQESEAHGGRDCHRHGRAHLPVRHVPSGGRGDSRGGRPGRPRMITRRDFIAALGGGIVVMIVDDEVFAQETGGLLRGRAPNEIGAWLHVGEDGMITTYTGKVEVGQNARTSLTQAVAEELRAPVASIRIVMGDTALTPFDQGTVGSQTTPRMWPQIRRAAAEAREMLLDLASQKWSVERASVRIAEGKLTAGARSAGFGELTRGEKLTRAIPANVALAPAADWK